MNKNISMATLHGSQVKIYAQIWMLRYKGLILGLNKGPLLFDNPSWSKLDYFWWVIAFQVILRIHKKMPPTPFKPSTDRGRLRLLAVKTTWLCCTLTGPWRWKYSWPKHLEKMQSAVKLPKDFFLLFQPFIRNPQREGRFQKKTSNCMKVIKKIDDVDVFFQPWFFFAKNSVAILWWQVWNLDLRKDARQILKKYTIFLAQSYGPVKNFVHFK